MQRLQFPYTQNCLKLDVRGISVMYIYIYIYFSNYALKNCRNHSAKLMYVGRSCS